MRSRRETCPWRESPFFGCAWLSSARMTCLTVLLLHVVSSTLADSVRTELNQTELVADEGQPLAMKCDAPKLIGNSTTNLFWILQTANGLMTTVNNSRMSVDPEGTLHFSSIALEDASGDNFYVCTAFSPVLREYRNGQLTKLIVRPSTTAALNDSHLVEPVGWNELINQTELVADEGQPLTMKCDAPIFTANPKPSLSWILTTPNGSITTVRGSRVSVDAEGTLRFSNITLQDASGDGFYACTAFSSALLEHWAGRWMKLVVRPSTTAFPKDSHLVGSNEPGTDGRQGSLTRKSRTASDPPIRGSSRENVLTEAPKNFMVNFIDDGSAMVEWNPVLADPIQGDIQGYKIQVTPYEENALTREVRVGPNTSRALVDVLKPASLNKVVVMAYNDQYDGPKSAELVITTPAAPPGPVLDLRAYPMGSSALLLAWKPPTAPNGDLNFYNVELFQVVGLAVSGEFIRTAVKDHLGQTSISIKLSRLDPDTQYRMKVFAHNQAGRGEHYTVEAATEPNRSRAATALLPPPGEPQFTLTDKTNDSIVVTWQPQDAASKGHRTGEYFYVEYRREGAGEWMKSKPVLHGLSTAIRGLEPGASYEIRVVAVEGEREVRGPIQKATTDGVRNP